MAATHKTIFTKTQSQMTKTDVYLLKECSLSVIERCVGQAHTTGKHEPLAALIIGEAGELVAFRLACTSEWHECDAEGALRRTVDIGTGLYWTIAYYHVQGEVFALTREGQLYCEHMVTSIDVRTALAHKVYDAPAPETDRAVYATIKRLH